jgi:hypothetical protein
MTKPKIFLLGSHAKRTPFAYHSYQTGFKKSFKFCDSPEDADLLLLGYVATFQAEKELVSRTLSLNPNIKFCVCSEEPLWETTGLHIQTEVDRRESLKSHSVYNLCGRSIDFLYLSHYNVLAPSGDFLPYYITTDDNFYLRYNHLIRRNRLTISSLSLNNLWSSSCSALASFFMERRINKNKYQFSFVNPEVKGLSYDRSLLAETLLAQTSESSQVRVEGQGWSKNSGVRQSLYDWHLDKIVRLDQSSLLISAIENTLHPFYITEKVFDAYACQGIPICVASSEHHLNSYLPRQSFVNLYESLDSIENSTSTIRYWPNKCLNPDFIDSYMKAQAKLYDMFKSVDLYLDSRAHYQDKVSKAVLDYIG